MADAVDEPVKVTAEQLGLHVGCVNSCTHFARTNTLLLTVRNSGYCSKSFTYLRLCYRDQFEGQLDFDLGNLTAYDPSPVDAEEFAKNPDAACLAAASKVTQALIAKLFALPSEAADVGRVAQLPAPTTALPRAKALPKPREPTKWEKFAAQKGITKRKRSREVWDEDTKEYKRRFGYNSIKDDAPAVIEAKASDQVSFHTLQCVMRVAHAD